MEMGARIIGVDFPKHSREFLRGNQVALHAGEKLIASSPIHDPDAKSIRKSIRAWIADI